MTRPKKLLAACALALATVGASATAALTAGSSPVGTDDRVQTISILERNTTLLPGTASAPALTSAHATAS
ncbi:hypothetical protein ITI46_15015 [Streptomyces oryzae]|uniref:Uncharacterized protein n=1 Tax=Streptomyces oryzae TaxID=1434886 RepID=A0ABS3XCG2_9ACTN|nr:hypothetical protein [Streptomyces oryzae]MBO8192969.1 hypothetical protein [Streptomyces oryzae]